MIRAAILDDYQNVAMSFADWSPIEKDVEVKIFTAPFKSRDEAIKALQGFAVIVGMRERTSFPRAVIEALPDLKLLITTGAKNNSFDLKAAAEHGVTVCGTGGFGSPTTGVVFGLLLELTRRIGFENARLKAGQPWQVTIGPDLEGMTLGVLGLGKLGQRSAAVAKAFGMNVIAWSQNLTPEKAAAAGATYVSKEELFAKADAVTIHVVLSDRSRGLVGAADLGRMKKTAYLVNTSRGPIIDEKALIAALKAKQIAGAGLDVFAKEPPAMDHPLLQFDNVIASPHTAGVTKEARANMGKFAAEQLILTLDGKRPPRVVNPEVWPAYSRRFERSFGTRPEA